MTPSDPGAVSACSIAVESPRSASELATIVRDAEAKREGLRLAGSASWLDAGHAVMATRLISLRSISGIISYNPADLTISCGAGTSIAELDDATRAHGQWCPLSPPGTDLMSTLGATVATAMESPYAATLGRPRSLVLGLECVDGTGRIIAAGGRVVKNVAGFDLTRLMIGAWGTLGAITQVHLRLRALPVVDECWMVRVRREDAAGLMAYAQSALAPLACVRLEPPAVSQGGPDDAYLVRIGGNAAFVAASRAALEALGMTAPQDLSAFDAWRSVHDPEPRALQWRWDPISIRLRDRFDPHRIMNPGLLGEPA